MAFRDDILDDLETLLTDWDDVLWDAITYKGIFHNEYEPVILFSGEIESRNPWVEVREADFSGITHDEILEINEIEYKVINIKPSGTGMMVLELSKN